MNLKAFTKYLATGEYVPTADAAPIDLAAHDRRFHPNGYKEGDRCQYREALANGDDVDAALRAESSSEKKKKRVQRSIEELMSNPDTEWHYSFECEHDGDVRRQENALRDSEAVKDIRTEEEPHGDSDYYTKITFKVTDYDKFEDYFESPVWEFANSDDMFYWVNDD